MADFDSIIADYLRATGYAASGGATSLPPEKAAHLKETFRQRVLDWASLPANKPHPTPPPPPRSVESVANNLNQQSINLGFLGEDMEYICASYLEDELRDIEMRDHEVNEDAAENKQLADLLEWKLESIEFAEPTIPLPVHNSERQDEVLEKMRHRFPVSAQKLPSSVMYTLLNSESNAACISMIHDGEKMAVGLADSAIRVFDMTTTVCSREDEGFGKKRRFEEFSGEGGSDGTGAAEDDRVETVNSSKAGPFPGVCFRGHTKSVTSLSWFDGGGIFLSGSVDGTVRLWSENLKSNICIFKGHLFPVLDVAACPVGYYFLSGSMDQSSRLWCTESLEPIRIFPCRDGCVDLVKWHSGCSYFGAASSDGQFRLWDISASNCVRLFKQTPSLRGIRVMTCFRFGADGNSIVCGYDDGKLEVTDLRQSTEILAVMDAHDGPIWDLDCSRGNGNLIATGGDDGRVKLWSLPDKKCAKTYKTRSCKILSTFWTISNLLITTGVPAQ